MGWHALTSDRVEGNVVDMLVPAELGITKYDGGSKTNTAYLQGELLALTKARLSWYLRRLLSDKIFETEMYRSPPRCCHGST